MGSRIVLEQLLKSLPGHPVIDESALRLASVIDLVAVRAVTAALREETDGSAAVGRAYGYRSPEGDGWWQLVLGLCDGPHGGCDPIDGRLELAERVYQRAIAHQPGHEEAILDQISFEV